MKYGFVSHDLFKIILLVSGVYGVAYFEHGMAFLLSLAFIIWSSFMIGRSHKW
jgi:hypothetical protein